MNRLPFGLALVLAPLLTCCASASQRIATQPVGPSPLSTPGHTSSGFLKVYSNPEAHFDGEAYTGDEDYYRHTDYRIYSTSGNVVAHVQNSPGIHPSMPAVVGLLPGSYTIEAEAEYYGLVRVPVVIESGNTTVVHLDGKQLRFTHSTVDADLVRLPNGDVVGWRVHGETSSGR